jgi:putative FmdB family regulatory protein
VYEYQCTPCHTIYEVRQRLSDPPLAICPTCQGPVQRIFSAPNLNRYNFSSPTAAKYAKLSTRDEMQKERELQKDYQKIWLPPPVQHDPWEDH